MVIGLNLGNPSDAARGNARGAIRNAVRRGVRGGVRVPHRKWTADSAIVSLPPPATAVIHMSQHIGAPCEPTVKKGDRVKVGQVIGDTDKYVSAPIHASVSGVVSRVGVAPHPAGGSRLAVEIESDGQMEPHPDARPKSFGGKEEFLSLVRASGLVGLGGAGFPAHVKLNPPGGARIDALIVNGAECEPYITADYRFILESAKSIVEGIKLIRDTLGIPNAVIGIEDNKPAAIKLMREMAGGAAEVRELKSLYPQGAEKMLIESCTGRRVPPGKLPLDVGAVVMNVNSVALIYNYIKTGMPLTRKIVTVSGSAVVRPQNVDAPIGAELADVFEFCGGFSREPEKIIMGGPMMGVAQHTLEAPIVKNTNAILAFDERDARLSEETSCIRCGRCVDNCPMRLLPLYLNAASVKRDSGRLMKYHVQDCIECGTCVYNCPAKRRIVQSVRLGKAQLRDEAAAQSALKGGS